MNALIAASFWSSPVAQMVLAGLVGATVFVVGWLLLGTAARAKKDRQIAARMAVVSGAGNLSQPEGRRERVVAGVDPAAGDEVRQAVRGVARLRPARR